jgi:hypothetical protein
MTPGPEKSNTAGEPPGQTARVLPDEASGPVIDVKQPFEFIGKNGAQGQN